MPNNDDDDISATAHSIHLCSAHRAVYHLCDSTAFLFVNVINYRNSAE